MQLGVALTAAGRLDDGAGTFRRLLQTHQLPEQLRTPAVVGAALVAHLQGAHDEAQALTRETLERLEDPDGADATVLRFALAAGSYFEADWASMRDWARAGLQAGQGTPGDRATGLGALALALYGLGDVTGALAHATEAAELVDSVPADKLAGHLEGLGWLGWSEFCLGRLREAHRHAERAVAIARQTGQQHLEPAMLIIDGMALLALGQPARATNAADAARESSSRQHNYLFEAWALTLECMIELTHGTPREAVRIGERALACGQRSYSPWAKVAGCYLAEAYLAAGDPARARGQLLGAGDEPDLPPLPFYHLRVFGPLAWAAVALGDLDEAMRWARQAAARADELGLDALHAEANRAIATVLLARGDAASAAETAHRAAAAAGRAQLDVEAARVLLVAAAAYARVGQLDDALASAHRARALAAAADAHPMTADAERQLHELGSRPQPAHTARALTPRERQVAELAAAGHSNRQISGELGVATKTVEATLTRALAKLGATSRTQVAPRLKQAHGSRS